jgi:hypothetical protein
MIQKGFFAIRISVWAASWDSSVELSEMPQRTNYLRRISGWAASWDSLVAVG